MRRTEPGEEHTSPEALDSYQTQNRGTARLLPASFRGKSASSRGTKLGEVSCGEGVGLQAARVGHSVPSAAPHRRCSSLGRKPTLPVSVGAELYPLGGSSTGRACSLVLWQLRWGPRAGLGQSGVPPRTLGLEPRCQLSGGRMAGRGAAAGRSSQMHARDRAHGITTRVISPYAGEVTGWSHLTAWACRQPSCPEGQRGAGTLLPAT